MQTAEALNDRPLDPEIVKKSVVLIKPARMSDAGWVIKEVREFKKLLGDEGRFITDDDEELLALSKVFVSNVCLIAWKGDERIGVIGGVFQPHPLNSKVRLLVEVVWWVSKGHRCSTAGYKLLRDFLAIGDFQADVTLITILDISPVSEKALRRLGLKNRDRTHARVSSNFQGGNNG